MATDPNQLQPMPDFSDEAQLAKERADDLGIPYDIGTELTVLQDDYNRGRAQSEPFRPDNNAGYPLIGNPGASSVRSFAADPRGGFNTDNTVADEHTWETSRDPLLTPTSDVRDLLEVALVQPVVPENKIEIPLSPDNFAIQESAAGKAAEIMKNALPTIINKPDPQSKPRRSYYVPEPKPPELPAHDIEAMIAAATKSWEQNK